MAMIYKFNGNQFFTRYRLVRSRIFANARGQETRKKTSESGHDPDHSSSAFCANVRPIAAADASRRDRQPRKIVKIASDQLETDVCHANCKTIDKAGKRRNNWKCANDSLLD